MMGTRIITFIILTLHTLTGSSQREGRGGREWLTLCSRTLRSGQEGQNFIIHDTRRCKTGYYFKFPMQGVCACANGVWQMKSDSCEESIIIDGRGGTCYKIPKQIQWVRYLGVPLEPKQEFNFVSDEKMKSIVPVGKEVTEAGYNMLVTVNPRQGFSDCANEYCYKREKSEDGTHRNGDPLPKILWANISDTRGHYFLPTCPAHPTIPPLPYPYGVPKGGMTFDGKFYKSSIQSSECYKQCYPAWSNISLDDNYWLDGRINNSLGIIEISNVEMSDTPLNVSDQDGDEPISCKNLPPPVDVREVTKRNIARQTQRMIRAYYDTILLGKRAPLVKLQEYNYFQIGRSILENTVPESEISHKTLRSLMLLFRTAVNESLEKYPYLKLGDEEEDVRLKSVLNSCLDHSKKSAFSAKYNTSQCPAQFEGMYITSDWPPDHQLNSNISCDVAYNSTDLDYPVELAWKIVMFTHYFCARFFNVTAFDHSRIEYKLRKLFNRPVVTRWYHPGKSNLAWKQVFKNADLEKVMASMDRFVAAAKYMSPYKTWIKRPKFEGGKHMNRRGFPTASRRENKSFPLPVLGGKGSCLANENQLDQVSKQSCPVVPRRPNCSTSNPPRKLQNGLYTLRVAHSASPTGSAYWLKNGKVAWKRNCMNFDARFHIEAHGSGAEQYIIRSLVGTRFGDFIFDDQGILIEKEKRKSYYIIKGVTTGLILASFYSPRLYVGGCRLTDAKCKKGQENYSVYLTKCS